MRLSYRSTLRLNMYYSRETYELYIVYTIIFIIKLENLYTHIPTNHFLRNRYTKNYYIRQKFKVHLELLANSHVSTRTKNTTFISLSYTNR